MAFLTFASCLRCPLGRPYPVVNELVLGECVVAT